VPAEAAAGALRALRTGDLVGVAAPAGPVDPERLSRGVAEIERLGFAVRVADGVLDRTGFTAGTAESRLAQLHALFADPDVRAIACARGGAGALQLLPRLDLALLAASPKLLLGYSDVTVLQLALGQLGIPSLHGPMVAWELANGEAAYDRASLWHALTGQDRPFASGEELLPLQDGAADGVLRGGCLSLLAALCGTPWALQTGGEPTILFVEDVDEPPYRVDRLLRQLRLSGALAGVCAFVFGEMRGCRPAAGADYRLEDVIVAALDGFQGPVAIGLPCGHVSTANVTLPLGARARLSCGAGGARFELCEAAVR
jgi:muramoyltetrapeptide carboxypeptidase